MKKNGFTLVELVAVLVIILLLTTLIFSNILQESGKMRLISDSKIEEIIISSAKSYVAKNPELKTRAKSEEAVEIQYSTLKNEGYLPNKMLDVTTYKNININDYMVCFTYDEEELKYDYLIMSISSNCK